jgi:hypothetical protein
MPQIPLYQKQAVQRPVSANVPLTDISSQIAQTEVDTLDEQLTNLAFDVGSDFIQQRIDLKEKSDDADFNLKKLQYAGESKQALQGFYEKGGSYKDAPNFIKDFYTQKANEIRSAGYSKNYTSVAYNNLLTLAQEQYNTQLLESIDIDNEDRIFKIKDSAGNFLDIGSAPVVGYINPETGNPEEISGFDAAKRVYQTLQPELGEAGWRDAYSTDYYNRKIREIESINQRFESGQIQSFNDYAIELSKVEEDVLSNDDLKAVHRDPLLARKNQAFTAEIRQLNDKRQKFERTYADKVASGTASFDDLETFKLYYPNETLESMYQIYDNAMTSVTVRNGDVLKAYEKIQELDKNPQNFGEVVKYIAKQSKKLGVYSEELRQMAVMRSMVQNNPESYVIIDTKFGFGGNVAMPITGWQDQIMDDLIFSYASTQDAGETASYLPALRKLAKGYQEFGVDATPEQIAQVAQNVLGYAAKEYTLKVNAPQDNTVGGYIVGRVYTDAKGNKAIWNGTDWKEVD